MVFLVNQISKSKRCLLTLMLSFLITGVPAVEACRLFGEVKSFVWGDEFSPDHAISAILRCKPEQVEGIIRNLNPATLQNLSVGISRSKAPAVIEIAVGPESHRISKHSQLVLIVAVIRATRDLDLEEKYPLMALVDGSLRIATDVSTRITLNFALAGLGSVVGTRGLIEILTTETLSDHHRLEAAAFLSSLASHSSWGRDKTELENRYSEVRMMKEEFDRFMGVEMKGRKVSDILFHYYYLMYTRVMRIYWASSQHLWKDFIISHFYAEGYSALCRKSDYKILNDSELLRLRKFLYENFKSEIDEEIQKLSERGNHRVADEVMDVIQLIQNGI